MVPDSVRIRRATTDDVQAIVAILGSHWPQLTNDPSGMAAAYERRMAEGERFAWIAEHGEFQIAAAVVDLNTGRRPRVIDTASGATTPDAVLDKLVVLERARGRRVGKQMQHALLADLAVGGSRLVALDVESENREAFVFWQHCGWQHVADEPNPGPGDAYRHVFLRHLAPSPGAAEVGGAQPPAVSVPPGPAAPAAEAVAPPVAQAAAASPST